MTHIPFSRAETAILLIDHQPGVVAMAQSVLKANLEANAAALAKLGNDLGIPLVTATTREDMAFMGTTIEPIRTTAPAAYAARQSCREARREQGGGGIVG